MPTPPFPCGSPDGESRSRELAPVERKTVLICDDQEDILFAIATFLKSRYKVLTAKSGTECLLKVRDGEANRIDVLLLDQRLSDMPGEQAAREIRRTNGSVKGLKIVLITAYDLDDTILSRMKREKLFDAQLKKPFGLAELGRTLDVVLRN
jgi:CheY-like chemotaxis protein